MNGRQELKQRYQGVMERVARAAQKSGRKACDIIVVAVTKTASPEQVRYLAELGHADFGENRVQHLQQRSAMMDEFLARQKLAGAPNPLLPQALRWHMIGHLQRNKVRAVLPLVRLIHSVDSLRLAEEIQADCLKLDREADILLQVNISGEKTKFGLPQTAVTHLAEQVRSMAHVRLRGLMTLAPYSDNPQDSRPFFQRCSDLFEEVRAIEGIGPQFNLLSMGMTNDCEVAIECGANLVRIGRAIFGESVEAQTAAEG